MAITKGCPSSEYLGINSIHSSVSLPSPAGVSKAFLQQHQKEIIAGKLGSVFNSLEFHPTLQCWLDDVMQIVSTASPVK